MDDPQASTKTSRPQWRRVIQDLWPGARKSAGMHAQQWRELKWSFCFSLSFRDKFRKRLLLSCRQIHPDIIPWYLCSSRSYSDDLIQFCALWLCGEFHIQIEEALEDQIYRQVPKVLCTLVRCCGSNILISVYMDSVVEWDVFHS